MPKRINNSLLTNKNFDLIIESLDVKLLATGYREVTQPVSIQNIRLPSNMLIMSRKGCLWAGPDFHFINNYDTYFIPLGQPAFLRHSDSKHHRELAEQTIISDTDRESIFKPVQKSVVNGNTKDVISIVSFFALLNGTIPLFQAMELPYIHFTGDELLKNLMDKLIDEKESNKAGAMAMTGCLMREIVIHILRFVFGNETLKHHLEKLLFLTDSRLIDVVNYIQKNLNKELTNDHIAKVLNVSREYAGQLFKSIARYNLQDYIEHRRLEKAHLILRTTGGSIQDVAKQVGFRDLAYFSKRFKMRYKENPSEVRKLKPGMN